VLFQLLVLIVRDSVITLSAIAYNVNNDLDEVLLATVCTVYNGNMFNRSRFFLKVNTVEALYPRVVENRTLKVVTSWHTHPTLAYNSLI